MSSAGAGAPHLMGPHLLGLAAALSVGACSGCASEPGDEPATSTGDGGGASSSAAVVTSTTSAATTATTGAGGAGGAGPSACADWPGWEDWDDYAASDDFCVPSSKQALPDPIAWEPCPPQAGLSTGCQQMKTPWPWEHTPLAYAASADVRTDGGVVLEFDRVAQAAETPYSMRVVAEADGPVRSAFLDARLEADDKQFHLLLNSSFGGVREGKTAFRMQPEGFTDIPEALIGGDVDQLHPQVLHSWESSNGHAVQVSSQFVAAYTAYRFEFAPWGGALETIVTAPPQHAQLTLHEDNAVWAAGTPSGGSDILGYTPSAGSPFILVPRPEKLGSVRGVGTDGEDLFWIQSTGKSSPQDSYTERTAMTAPYTMDPSALAPKSLGSYPITNPDIANPSTVGCGYAAHHHSPGKTRIIRLSDGYWWELPSGNCTPPDFSTDWCFGRPLALTCDEIFLSANDEGIIFNLVRVDLSVLGAPKPPT